MSMGLSIADEVIQVTLEPTQNESKPGEDSQLRLNHETLGATRNRSGARIQAKNIGLTKKEVTIGRLGVVVSDKADIRSYPNSRGRVLYTCIQGMYLALVGQSGDWYGVFMIDGSIGWVQKKCVNLLDYEVKAQTSMNSDLGNSIVATALKYLGVPYRWGGYSTSGLDCSGFVKAVFESHGIRLPRVSRDQALMGLPVSWSELQPGDRLYFACKGSQIDHTGIYIGNGLFIHSSSSRQGVAIDSIFSPFYSRSFVIARRTQ
jgi:hypothetical protein